MNIQPVLCSYAPAPGVNPRNETLAASSSGSVAASAPVSASFRDILARYDVRQISPREFSELVQKLFDAGEIGQAEVQELSLLRLELDQSQADADQPLDLVRFLQDKLRQQEDEINRLNRRRPEQAIDRNAALAVTRRQLEWIEKFASVQAAGFSDALDRVI